MISATRLSQIQKLKAQPRDEAVWETFINKYLPLVQGICRQFRLQDADTEDVSQAVMSKLARRLLTFEYDPSGTWRAYVSKATRNEIVRFLEQAQKRGQVQAYENLDHLAAPEEFDEFADVFKRALADQTLHVVKSRVNETTWNAFSWSLGGEDAASVGQKLGMTPTAVYQAKCRVLRMAREELAMIDRLGTVHKNV